MHWTDVGAVLREKTEVVVKLSPEESMEEVRRYLRLLSSSVEEQHKWARDNDFAVDEMMLQFIDAVPARISWFRDEGLIDDSGELALLRLRVYFDTVMREIPGQFNNWTIVESSPAWQKVRELAGAALSSLEG